MRIMLYPERAQIYDGEVGLADSTGFPDTWKWLSTLVKTTALPVSARHVLGFVLSVYISCIILPQVNQQGSLAVGAHSRLNPDLPAEILLLMSVSYPRLYLQPT
jgi:hypothetical protein